MAHCDGYIRVMDMAKNKTQKNRFKIVEEDFYAGKYMVGSNSKLYADDDILANYKIENRKWEPYLSTVLAVCQTSKSIPPRKEQEDIKQG